jgi:predicted nucleotidyltransferase
MDFRRPLEAVIPGVQGKILGVLVNTTAELNLRTIAQLAGVSLAQASRVLPDLVDLGIVDRREAPPSALFHLVEDHLVTQALRDLSFVPERMIEVMREAAETLPVRPAGVIVFGSFARGEAEVASDIDAVLIRPESVDEEDPAWADSVEQWRETVGRASGNAVEVLEVSESDIGRKLRGRQQLWRDIRSEGVVVTGPSLAVLIEAARG